MPRPFPGHPEYVARAAAELSVSGPALHDAGRQPALTLLASLVSQALDRPEGPHPDTVRRAAELSNGLHVASRAAALMLAEISPAPAKKAKS